MSMEKPSSAGDHRVTRLGLLSGFVLAALLVVALLVRYPGDADTRTAYLGGGGVAVLVLLAAGWVAARGTRARSTGATSALLVGTGAGLLLGAVWVVEIGVVNFLVAPGIVAPSLRDPASIGAVAAVAALTLALGAASAFRARRVMAGARVGFWSGLVSGLVACLAGLLLAAVWTDFVMLDPLSVGEWAERGDASGAPDAATYRAHETTTGALPGHLLLLGIAQGTLLGAAGGIAGRALAAARDGAWKSRPGSSR